MLSSGWLRYPSSAGAVPLGQRTMLGFPKDAMYSAAEMNSFSDPMWRLRLSRTTVSRFATARPIVRSSE